MTRPNPQLTGPPPGLLTRILLTAVGVVTLVAAAFLGAFFFLAAIGVFVVLAAVMAFRGWRLKREVEKAMRGGGRRSERRGTGEGTTVEGEYVVVNRRTEREKEGG